MNRPQPNPKRALLLGGLVVLIWLTLVVTMRRAQAAVPHLGYGFNVAAWDIDRLGAMGFDWIKVFNPPGDRLPVNVLLRLEAQAADLGDLNGFGDEVYQTAVNHAPFIDAYEIGNEVNLDAGYGWGGAPPVAADYAALLCVAYDRIHQADPNAIVVSAGLAPTGRVTGNWNGHPGHNGLYQDEREFLREFLAAGGADCLDAVGYHPYGFSADYDAEPDVPSGDPAQNCANGFCFRGVEKIYEILVENGRPDLKLWATEYGWIVDPPSHCLSDPGWQGRQWQIVSEAKQASNLRGSFEYADANWPWMGAMIVFNLNFNHAGYPLCEQMRYYAVQDRPAEAALSDMPKNPASLPARLETTPLALSAFLPTSQQPATLTMTLNLSNSGWQSTSYTVTAVSGYDLAPSVPAPTGTLPAGGQAAVAVIVTAVNLPDGVYDGLLEVTAAPGTAGAPQQIPVQLLIFEPTDAAFLPLIQTSP